MATSSKLPFTINATGTTTGLFIFLHGLGDTGYGWSTMFEAIRKKHIKYVFPNAESMPVTLNFGMKMPSWFDIAALDMSGKEDEAGIKKAAESIRALIKKEQEAASVPSERVILGGFSMTTSALLPVFSRQNHVFGTYSNFPHSSYSQVVTGGALALYTGLTHKEPLGGMVLLSSWLPLREKFSKNADGLSLASQKCPIFQGHGDSDQMVKTIFGSKTHELLAESRGDAGMEFKLYKGLGHSSSEEELHDVAAFIEKQLGSA